jgi:hypothetical protein
MDTCRANTGRSPVGHGRGTLGPTFPTPFPRGRPALDPRGPPFAVRGSADRAASPVETSRSARSDTPITVRCAPLLEPTVFARFAYYSCLAHFARFSQCVTAADNDDGPRPVREHQPRALTPTLLRGTRPVREPTDLLAVVLADMPEVVATLLREHVPDRFGRCRACGTPAPARRTWPPPARSGGLPRRPGRSGRSGPRGERRGAPRGRPRQRRHDRHDARRIRVPHPPPLPTAVARGVAPEIRRPLPSAMEFRPVSRRRETGRTRPSRPAHTPSIRSP